MRRGNAVTNDSAPHSGSTRSHDRYDRYAKAVDTPMLIITIAWLPALIVPLVAPVHGAVATSLLAINLIVWALFALKYLVKFAVAPDRGHYFRTAATIQLHVNCCPHRIKPIELPNRFGDTARENANSTSSM